MSDLNRTGKSGSTRWSCFRPSWIWATSSWKPVTAITKTKKGTRTMTTNSTTTTCSSARKPPATAKNPSLSSQVRLRRNRRPAKTNFSCLSLPFGGNTPNRKKSIHSLINEISHKSTVIFFFFFFFFLEMLQLFRQRSWSIRLIVSKRRKTIASKINGNTNWTF